MTFNKAVTGVDASDFSLALSSGVYVTAPLVVTTVNSSVYTVTVNDILGAGTIGLNLVDNGTIHDLAGNPLAEANGSVPFQAQATVSTGQFPNSVVLADLSGNGILDLIETNQNDGTVSVYMGNGNGTFGSPTTYAAGSQPDGIAVGDLNGDGKLDLVISNIDHSSNYLTILLGNGDGTFQTATTLNLGFRPGAVAVADLIGNGRADLIVGDSTNSGFEVLLGNGDGTFQAPTHVFGGDANSIAVADVNGDTLPDVVTVDALNDLVSVYLGNGDGTFQNPHTYFVGGAASGLGRRGRLERRRQAGHCGRQR